ncbi:MAG: hypothetical protein WD770_11740 [Actinomycetota bacterium]
MRPVRLILPALLSLAACGGSSPPELTATTPPTTAPSPSVDPAERARHSTCLDFARARRPMASSTDIPKELGDAMDELANELHIDAGLYEDAEDAATAELVAGMSADARESATRLRAESDAGVALTNYTASVDELLARLGEGTCDPELEA